MSWRRRSLFGCSAREGAVQSCCSDRHGSDTWHSPAGEIYGALHDFHLLSSRGRRPEGEEERIKYKNQASSPQVAAQLLRWDALEVLLCLFQQLLIAWFGVLGLCRVRCLVHVHHCQQAYMAGGRHPKHPLLPQLHKLTMPHSTGGIPSCRAHWGSNIQLTGPCVSEGRVCIGLASRGQVWWRRWSNPGWAGLSGAGELMQTWLLADVVGAASDDSDHTSDG